MNILSLTFCRHLLYAKVEFYAARKGVFLYLQKLSAASTIQSWFSTEPYKARSEYENNEKEIDAINWFLRGEIIRFPQVCHSKFIIGSYVWTVGRIQKEVIAVVGLLHLFLNIRGGKEISFIFLYFLQSPPYTIGPDSLQHKGVFFPICASWKVHVPSATETAMLALHPDIFLGKYEICYFDFSVIIGPFKVLWEWSTNIQML